jgi:hypothetical protein
MKASDSALSSRHYSFLSLLAIVSSHLFVFCEPGIKLVSFLSRLGAVPDWVVAIGANGGVTGRGVMNGVFFFFT